MTMHTPGPWRFECRDGRKHIYPFSGGSIMCDEKYYPWVPNKDKDWELIAAAPDMLEALEAFVEKHKWGLRHSKEYQMAVDAIAKAKGESA